MFQEILELATLIEMYHLHSYILYEHFPRDVLDIFSRKTLYSFCVYYILLILMYVVAFSVYLKAIANI